MNDTNNNEAVDLKEYIKEDRKTSILSIIVFIISIILIIPTLFGVEIEYHLNNIDLFTNILMYGFLIYIILFLITIVFNKVRGNKGYLIMFIGAGLLAICFFQPFNVLELLMGEVNYNDRYFCNEVEEIDDCKENMDETTSTCTSGKIEFVCSNKKLNSIGYKNNKEKVYDSFKEAIDNLKIKNNDLDLLYDNETSIDTSFNYNNQTVEITPEEGDDSTSILDINEEQTYSFKEGNNFKVYTNKDNKYLLILVTFDGYYELHAIDESFNEIITTKLENIDNYLVSNSNELYYVQVNDDMCGVESNELHKINLETKEDTMVTNIKNKESGTSTGC